MLKKYEKVITSLKNAFYTATVIGLLIGPFISFKLDGFSVQVHLMNAFFLVLSIFIIQFFFMIFKQSALGHKFIQLFSLLKHQKIHVTQQKWHPITIALMLLAGILLPLVVSNYWISVAILSLIYILLGLGLNIVVGLAGLLNLGFAAFFALGAYAFALGAEYLHIGFWLAIPFAALLTAAFGALLSFPVLKMHGDYLAIVTLGFAEITRLVLVNWGTFTGGPNGLSVPDPTFFGIEFSRIAKQNGIPFHELFQIPYDTGYRNIFIYFVAFIVVVLTIRLVTHLQRMPLGRAFEALREDEIACSSLGINHVTTKLSAFSLGAMLGGIGGVFFATFEKFVNPASFTFMESALILAIVVLGGMGSTLGVVLSAIILTLLPELLRNFSEYRMLVFGILMVLMMIWRPQGLVRLSREWISPKVVKKND